MLKIIADYFLLFKEEKKTLYIADSLFLVCLCKCLDHYMSLDRLNLLVHGTCLQWVWQRGQQSPGISPQVFIRGHAS